MRNAELLRRLKAAGFEFNLAEKGKHIKIRQNGVLVGVVSRGSQAMEPRAHRNFFTELRQRTGIDLRKVH